MLEKILLDNHLSHTYHDHTDPTIKAKNKNLNIAMGVPVCAIHKDHFITKDNTNQDNMEHTPLLNQNKFTDVQHMDNCDYQAPNEKMIELSLQKLISTRSKVGDFYLKFSKNEENKQKSSNKAFKKSMNKWEKP